MDVNISRVEGTTVTLPDVIAPGRALGGVAAVAAAGAGGVGAGVLDAV
jgi:hypothetical protein